MRGSLFSCGVFFLGGLFTATLGWCSEEPASAFKVNLQTRVKAGDGFKVVTRSETWEPKETAIIVCDMWDLHHCKNAVLRITEMAPRMNAVLEERGLGAR